MRELSTRVLAVACFAALLVTALPARAEFASDGGFDVGANGKFQPGLRFLATYQSNVYRSEADTEADIALRLEPHLKLALRSENANLDLWSVYYLKKYTDAFVDHAYDPVGHRDLDIFLNYDLGIDLETRPEGKFSFLFADKFERKSTEFDNTSIASTTEGTEESARFHQYSLMDRLANEPGSVWQYGREVPWRSKGSSTSTSTSIPARRSRESAPNRRVVGPMVSPGTSMAPSM